MNTLFFSSNLLVKFYRDASFRLILCRRTRIIDSERVKEIQSRIESVLSKPPEDYIENTERWGEFSFKEVENEIQAIYYILVRLSKLPLVYIPHDHQLFQIEKFCELFKKVEEFNVGETDIADKNALFEEIKNELNLVFDQNGVFMPILALFDPAEGGAMEKAIELQKEAKEIRDNTVNYLEEAQSKVDALVESMQSVAADIGVGKFADDFSKQAKVFAKSARNWLIATILFVTLTFGVATGFLLYPFKESESIELVVQLSISKIVILGLLFGATIWCGRHFRALKHQESICWHRSNALATFQAFVQAANETSTKEAVLLETTRSIFALSATGFLGNSDNSNGDNLKIVELFRGMATKASE